MMYRAKLIACSLIAMGLSYGAMGCKGTWKQHDIDRCATIPSGAIPAPAGTHVNAWQCAQVASAARDRGVFYQNEFAPKSSELSATGQEHVKEAIQQSLYNNVPILIEPSADPMLDQARLQSVHAMFASAGVVLSPEQIFIAKPQARGLDGFRAQQAVRASMINAGGGMGAGAGNAGANGGGMGGIGGMGGMGGMGVGGVF